MIVFIAYDKKETPFNLKGVSFYDQGIKINNQDSERGSDLRYELFQE
jgi:hypothetical protein